MSMSELERAEKSLVVRKITPEEWAKWGPPVDRKTIKIPFMGWGKKP